MTRVDLTKAQCAKLANYLRGILNNGMGAGSFDKIEMLVLARRALAAAEELPEASSVAAHAPAAELNHAAECVAEGYVTWAGVRRMLKEYNVEVELI